MDTLSLGNSERGQKLRDQIQDMVFLALAKFCKGNVANKLLLFSFYRQKLQTLEKASLNQIVFFKSFNEQNPNFLYSQGNVQTLTSLVLDRLESEEQLSANRLFYYRTLECLLYDYRNLIKQNQKIIIQSIGSLKYKNILMRCDVCLEEKVDEVEEVLEEQANRQVEIFPNEFEKFSLEDNEFQIKRSAVDLLVAQFQLLSSLCKGKNSANESKGQLYYEIEEITNFWRYSEK